MQESLQFEKGEIVMGIFDFIDNDYVVEYQLTDGSKFYVGCPDIIACRAAILDLKEEGVKVFKIFENKDGKAVEIRSK